MSAPTYLFGLCACEAGVLPRYVHAHFISPRSPRSLLVHVTHQSAVCSPLLRQCGGRAEECSLCAILGHTGCSSSVTTAVHGCVFASFFTCMDCGCRHVCIFLCVCVCSSTLQMHTSLDCPLQDNDLLPAIANEWKHFEREREPIYCPGNLSINGQPLAGVCHCLTLSCHFKLVLISHSQM